MFHRRAAAPAPAWRGLGGEAARCQGGELEMGLLGFSLIGDFVGLVTERKGQDRPNQAQCVQLVEMAVSYTSFVGLRSFHQTHPSKTR